MVMCFLCHAHWLACAFPVSRPLIRMRDTHKAELHAWSSEVARGVMVIAVRVRVRARDREWIFHCFFFSCLKK